MSPHWRAWYATSRTSWTVYSSTDTPWEEIPPGETDGPKGVVGVVLYLDPPYREIVAHGDWYWDDGETIRTVPTHPRWGRWSPSPVGVSSEDLKASGSMRPSMFEEVQAEMMEAREWR